MILAKKLAGVDSEEDIREAFKVFDKDGNGYITHKDIHALLTKLGDGFQLSPDEVDDMIAEADTSKDGKVDINGK